MGVLQEFPARWRLGELQGFKLCQEKELDYPFAVQTGNPGDRLIGTLLEWPAETAPAAIARCNRIEGFSEDRPKDGMYLLSVTEVRVDNMDTVSAYVYHQLLPRDTDELISFPLGDWLQDREA